MTWILASTKNDMKVIKNRGKNRTKLRWNPRPEFILTSDVYEVVGEGDSFS